MDKCKNGEIKVSIIMSVYNDENTVETAIKSILAQKFSEFEFIIIDDYSTDTSLSIIQKKSKIDDRIKVVINEENKGLAASLNLGLNMAKSELIARMDADDFSLPDRILSQFNFLKENERVDILGTSANVVDEYGDIYDQYIFPENNQDIVDEMSILCPIIHPTVMFRKNIVQSVGGYNEDLRKGQDFDLWLRLKNVAIFSNLRTPLLEYYMPKKRPIKKIVYIFFQLIRTNPTGWLPWKYLIKYLLMYFNPNNYK